MFFVSGRFVGNQDLAMDNLICHVANTRGMDAISKAASDAVKSPVNMRCVRSLRRFSPARLGRAARSFSAKLWWHATGHTLKELAEQPGST